MATVTVFTAERMQAIEDAEILSAGFVDSHLILNKKDGTTIDAGQVVLKAPDGSLHQLAVANDGTLSTTPV